MQIHPSQHTNQHTHSHQQHQQGFLNTAASMSASPSIPYADSLTSSTLQGVTNMVLAPSLSSSSSSPSKRPSLYAAHMDHDDAEKGPEAKREAGASSSSLATTSTTYAYAHATLISRPSSMSLGENESVPVNSSPGSHSLSSPSAAAAGASASAAPAANGLSSSPSSSSASLSTLHALPASSPSASPNNNSSIMDYSQAHSSTRPSSQQPHQQQPQPSASLSSSGQQQQRHHQQEEPQTTSSPSPLASSISLNSSPYHNPYSYPLPPPTSSPTNTPTTSLDSLQGQTTMSPLSTPFSTVTATAVAPSSSSSSSVNTTSTPMATMPSSLTQYRSPTLASKTSYGLRSRARRDSTPSSNVAFSPPSTYGSPLNQHQQLSVGTTSHHSSGLVFQAANNHRLSHLLQTSPYPPRGDRTRCLSTSSVESNTSCSTSGLSRLTPAMASMSVYQASPLGGSSHGNYSGGGASGGGGGGGGGGYNSGASSPYYGTSPPSNSYASAQHSGSGSSSYPAAHLTSPLQHQQPMSFSSPTSSAANAVVAAAAASQSSYYSGAYSHHNTSSSSSSSTSHPSHAHGYTSPTSPPPASVTSATASPLTMGATHSLLTQDPVRLLQQLEFSSPSSSSATAASSLHGRLEQAVGSGNAHGGSANAGNSGNGGEGAAVSSHQSPSAAHAQAQAQAQASAAAVVAAASVVVSPVMAGGGGTAAASAASATATPGTTTTTTTGSSDMCLGVQDGFQPYMAMDGVHKPATTASASATSDFGLGIVMMSGADGVPIVGSQHSGVGLQAMQSNAASVSPSAKIQAEPKMILSDDGKTQLFPCGQCEKVFTTKSNLKRHLENINIHNTPYERRRDQKRWQGHEKKHASREETTLRMRRWREANREKNKFNDMRCRVYRIAKDKFGLEDSDEKEAWIQAEIEKRKSMLLLRHSRKTEWKDNNGANSTEGLSGNADSAAGQSQGSNNGSNNGPSEGDRNFIEMLKTSNGPRRRRSRQALTAAGTPLRNMTMGGTPGGMVSGATTGATSGFFRSDSPNMVQSPVASMMTTHSFLSSHAADRRFSAPDGSQLFGQGGGGSGNAVHSSFSNNFGIGFGGFNGAGSNGGMVDYKKQPYQQQQSSYYQQDPLTRRPRKQRSATENSKAFMQSGWDNAGFFPGFSNTTMNATAPTGSTSFDGNTGPSTSSILRHDEFGPYHQHYPQQQSSSSQYYSSSPQQFQQHQQQQQHQALLAMPIGSEQDNRLQELYQGVYHNRALADPTHSVLMEHQQQKAAEAAAAAAAAAAATVSGFADSSTPSQQQQQNAPYSFHDSVESMTASLSIGHPRDTSSSSTSSMMDRDASAAGWVDWSSHPHQQVSHQHPQHQHHYQTQHQQQHAYHPHMYSSYQTYSTDTGYPSQSGGTGMNAFPSSPSLDQQSQQPQVEEVWKAGMDRLGEYPFPEMTGHAASLFGSTAGHNNKHRKTARDAGIRLDIPPPAPVTNSLMTTVAAATAAAAANGAGPMESADGLGPATA